MKKQKEKLQIMKWGTNITCKIRKES